MGRAVGQAESPVDGRQRLRIVVLAGLRHSRIVAPSWIPQRRPGRVQLLLSRYDSTPSPLMGPFRLDRAARPPVFARET